MALTDFYAWQDDAFGLGYNPEPSHAEVTFSVPGTVNLEVRSVLYYTIVNKMVCSYDIVVNGHNIIDHSSIGPDGEHKVQLTVPPGVLLPGRNRMNIAVETTGVVHFAGISAWLPGSGGAEARQVTIPDLSLELRPSTAHEGGVFDLPDPLDAQGDGALEFTIKQKQPRLRYSMAVNTTRGVEAASEVPPAVGTYDLIEFVSAGVFSPGDNNRLGVDILYGAEHIYFGEIVFWWQRR